ncbi:hypothetical protein VSS37_10775 [Candidatus Thiothrix sp. Deng01]|uniref:Anti sigma-E protein RseA N-terminal domain-containing protein n=1 Tax=Candidatus Thiothrix phosphatis TaxID=3112415 RepID=A0ABU6CXF9_9GAMM|nr:hypothetical protein [Candidatus Thiothrix sp. Deng01]MEB4591464.1 hypothetical protein [Candidatus Thiothrix sp. Deng01]
MTGMTKEFTERLLVEAVRQGMDETTGNLDWQTQARLTRMRLLAQEQSGHLSEGAGFSSFSRGFAVATAVTLAITLWVLPNVKDSLPGAAPMLGDRTAKTSDVELDANVMDVLMSNEDMDFLENLEIYEWLEAEYG